MILGRTDESVKLIKLKNGWRVSHCWEEKSKSGDRYDTDWETADYAYPTLEEAVAKVTEVAGTFKD